MTFNPCAAEVFVIFCINLKLTQILHSDDKNMSIYEKWSSEKSNSLTSPYSAGIDFRRQNLTSLDVRF